MDPFVNSDSGDFVEITEAFLKAGASWVRGEGDKEAHAGWNADQLRLINAWPARAGWQKAVLGRRVPRGTATLFFLLRGLPKGARRALMRKNTAGLALHRQFLLEEQNARLRAEVEQLRAMVCISGAPGA